MGNKNPNFTSIYKVTNLVNSKVYIGVTKMKVKDRFTLHRYDALVKNKPFPLAGAIRKYGVDKFIVETIYCSKDEIYCKLTMEAYFVGIYDSYNTGYNATLGGQNPILKKRSAEATLKSANARRGIKRTLEQKERISKSIERFRYKIIFPDGKEIEITNLNKFCKENGLHQANMSQIASGKRGHRLSNKHHGFTCQKLGII